MEGQEEQSWEGEEDLAKELHQFKDKVRAELADLSQDLKFLRDTRREAELTITSLDQSIRDFRKELDRGLRQIDDNNERFTSFATEMTKISNTFDEIYSDLRLKATQKELTVLEGRFSFMCPMTTAQKLEYDLQEKASELSVLELKQDFNEFKTRAFEEFSLKRELQDAVYRVNYQAVEALKPYAKEVDCSHRFKDAEANLKAQTKAIMQEIAVLTEKISTTNWTISEMQETMETKATISEVNTVNQRFDGFSSVQDLGKLRKEVTILLRKCENRLEEFSSAIAGQEQVLARYDEVLLEKASKLDLKDVNIKIRAISKHIDFEQKVEEMDAAIKETAQLCENHAHRLNSVDKGLTEALGVTRNVKSEKKDISVLKEKVGNHAEMLDLKADKVDFAYMSERKANIEEFHSSLQAIDVLHRMVKATSVLLSHSLKSLYKSQDSKGLDTARRDWLLKHAEIVVNWANDFSPLQPDQLTAEEVKLPDPPSPMNISPMSVYVPIQVESPKFGGTHRRLQTKAIKLPSIDTSF